MLHKDRNTGATVVTSTAHSGRAESSAQMSWYRRMCIKCTHRCFWFSSFLFNFPFFYHKYKCLLFKNIFISLKMKSKLRDREEGFRKILPGRGLPAPLRMERSFNLGSPGQLLRASLAETTLLHPLSWVVRGWGAHTLPLFLHDSFSRIMLLSLLCASDGLPEW